MALSREGLDYFDDYMDKLDAAAQEYPQGEPERLLSDHNATAQREI